jgi:predicted HicB family RNase H-like nuclease
MATAPSAEELGPVSFFLQVAFYPHSWSQLYVFVDSDSPPNKQNNQHSAQYLTANCYKLKATDYHQSTSSMMQRTSEEDAQQTENAHTQLWSLNSYHITPL